MCSMKVITEYTPINELRAHMDYRVWACLTNGRYEIIDDVLKASEAELLKLPNFGKRSLKTLMAFLNQHGFEFDGAKAERAQPKMLLDYRFVQALEPNSFVLPSEFFDLLCISSLLEIHSKGLLAAIEQGLTEALTEELTSETPPKEKSIISAWAYVALPSEKRSHFGKDLFDRDEFISAFRDNARDILSNGLPADCPEQFLNLRDKVLNNIPADCPELFLKALQGPKAPKQG